MATYLESVDESDGRNCPILCWERSDQLGRTPRLELMESALSIDSDRIIETQPESYVGAVGLPRQMNRLTVYKCISVI